MCPRGHLLHLVGWRGDAEVATAFTAAPLIGTALALEVQAIASPAAMVRKKSVLRMNVSPEVHETNGAPFQFHVRSAATEKGRAPLADRRRPSRWTVLSNADGVTCQWTERARDAADPTLQPTVGH